MRYRIELSSSRNGFARINVPGRIIEIEAADHVGPVWQVRVTDQSAAGSGAVTVRADNAHDAVWRVARAAVRAVSELTGSAIEGELGNGSEESPSNLL
jgi:hypothetical protein